MAPNRLSELTIVIPSFERQSYLERQVQLWRRTSAKVEIVDGSAVPWQCPGTDGLPENITYWHIPRSLEERLDFAIGRISTPYAVLLSDDELYLPSALESCVDELALRADLVACKGLAVGFNATKEGVTGYPMYPALRGYSIDQNEPGERILAHMCPYSMATLWAVMKSDVFKRTLSAISAAGRLGCAATGEMQVSLIAAWSGKCAVLDELMWLRSLENKNIWWDSGPLSFHTWYSDSKNATEVRRFLDTTVNAASTDVTRDRDIRAAMRKAIAAYVEMCRRQESRNARALIRMRVLQLVPRRLRDRIRAVLAGVRGQEPSPSRATTTLDQTVRQLQLTGVTVNWKELEGMVEIIRASHA